MGKNIRVWERAVWPGHNKICQSHSHFGHICSFSSECKKSCKSLFFKRHPCVFNISNFLMLICKNKYFTCLLQGSAHRNHVPEAAEAVPHAGNWSWKCCPHCEGMKGHGVQLRLGTVREDWSLWDLRRGYSWKFNSVAAENLSTFELLAPWDDKKK